MERWREAGEEGQESGEEGAGVEGSGRGGIGESVKIGVRNCFCLTKKKTHRKLSKTIPLKYKAYTRAVQI